MYNNNLVFEHAGVIIFALHENHLCESSEDVIGSHERHETESLVGETGKQPGVEVALLCHFFTPLLYNRRINSQSIQSK